MAHRYRLYPTPEQAVGLARHCADARFVWNLALEYFNAGHSLRRADVSQAGLTRQLTEARAAEPWLAAGSQAVQDGALLDFRQALLTWWNRPRTGQDPAGFGRPTWRSRNRHNGFRVRSLSVRRVGRKFSQLLIPKVGYVAFRRHRPIPAGAKSGRVTQDRAGRWWVSFPGPQPAFVRQPTGRQVGVDRGVAHTAVLSSGQMLDMPAGLTPGQAQRKRRLLRTLARQQKGSARRERTRQSLARLDARAADRRKHWVETISTDLVRGHDLIAVENLQVKAMTATAKGSIDAPGVNVAAKAGLNRAIRESAWSMLRTRLEQKAAAATSPVQVVAVNPAYTSQRCACCGHTASDNRESQAVFRCRRCAHSANADVNAAYNILNAAKQAVTGRGGTPGHGPREASKISQPPGCETLAG